MIDKVQKIREEVVEMVNSINPFIPDEDGKNSEFESGRLSMATHILQLIDSLQEETVSNDVLDTVDKKAKKIWNEINTGHEYSIIESYNQFYGICMEIAEMVQEEPASEKKCMFTKDGYTDEDRKVLCEDCKEKCEYSNKDNLFDNAKFGNMFLTTENKQAVFLRFAENAEYKFAFLYVEDWGNVQVFRHNGKAIYNDAAHSIISKKEEPVSEELEKAAVEAFKKIVDSDKNSFLEIFKAGAQWQKQQDQSTIELAEDHAMLAGMEKMKEEMMAKAVGVEVKIDAGGYPYIPQIELYDYDKDEPLAKKGDKYKVVLIKEE